MGHLQVDWKSLALESASLPETLETIHADASLKESISVSGICPTCRGIMTVNWPKITRPVGASDVIGQGWGSGPTVWVVVMECNCGHKHTGQKSGRLDAVRH